MFTVLTHNTGHCDVIAGDVRGPAAIRYRVEYPAGMPVADIQARHRTIVNKIYSGQCRNIAGVRGYLRKQSDIEILL